MATSRGSVPCNSFVHHPAFLGTDTSNSHATFPLFYRSNRSEGFELTQVGWPLQFHSASGTTAPNAPRPYAQALGLKGGLGYLYRTFLELKESGSRGGTQL